MEIDPIDVEATINNAREFISSEQDLSTFGKALGNGFSIAALVGKRELMDLVGLRHNKEPVVEHLWKQGERLGNAVNRSIVEHNLEGFVEVIGKPCCLVYATRDQNKEASQAFRTLFLQETIRRGLLAPSLIVSYSHGDAEIDQIAEIIHEALHIYRKALDEGIDKYLEGRPVKPVWRKYNSSV